MLCGDETLFTDKAWLIKKLKNKKMHSYGLVLLGMKAMWATRHGYRSLQNIVEIVNQRFNLCSSSPPSMQSVEISFGMFFLPRLSILGEELIFCCSSWNFFHFFHPCWQWDLYLLLSWVRVFVCHHYSCSPGDTSCCWNNHRSGFKHFIFDCGQPWEILLTPKRHKTQSWDCTYVYLRSKWSFNMGVVGFGMWGRAPPLYVPDPHWF